MIYADNAATTKMSEAAIRELVAVNENTYGNPSTLYSIGQSAKEVLEKAREKVAAVIGAEPNEIYFTSGGSEADNQAIISAAENGRKSGKMHIVSTAFEHHAVLNTLEKLRKNLTKIRKRTRRLQRLHLQSPHQLSQRRKMDLQR